MRANCCENPEINGRWSYVSSELVSGYAYCKECGQEWKYDYGLKTLVMQPKKEKPNDKTTDSL